MLKIVIAAIVGGIITGLFTGGKKLARIRRLKSENKMLLERNEACSNENVQLIGQLTDERDKKRAFRRDLLLWENLANEIAKHPHSSPVKLTVPETGIELLKYYTDVENKLTVARMLIDEKIKMVIHDDEMARNWKNKAAEFLKSPDPETNQS